MRNVNFEEDVPAIPQTAVAMQEAFKDAIRMLALPYGDCILSGVVIGDLTGGVFPVSEGYVLLGGEVLHVPAHTVPSTAGTRYLYKTNISVSDYPIVKFTGETVPMVTETIGRLKVAGAPSVGEVAYNSLIRVDDKIKKLLSGKWVKVTPEAGCDFEIGVAGVETNYLSYTLEGDNLILRGSIRIVGNLANNTTKIVSVLPAGFRPLLSGLVPFVPILDHMTRSFILQILNNGQIRITNKSGSTVTDSIIGFMDVRFRIDLV